MEQLIIINVKGGLKMNEEFKKELLIAIISAVVGALVTAVASYFLIKPSSFTFLLNGDEITVTETEYIDLTNLNKQLEDELLLVKEQLNDANLQITDLQEKLDIANTENDKIIEEQNSEEEIQQVIDKATTYWNNTEYIESLSTLKNNQNKSDSIKLLYKQYSDEYCTYILNLAEDNVSKREYDKAITLINDAKELVDDSTTLDSKLTEINNKTPQKLSSIKISSSRRFEQNNDAVVEDTVGNRYTSSNLYLTSAEGKDGYGYGSFYLGKKYSTISGLIAVSDESENREDVQLEGWIGIYIQNNDEYTQVYSSNTLSRMSSPISFSEIDISNADWLEIRYYNNGEYFNLAQGYHSLNIILSDILLYTD